MIQIQINHILWSGQTRRNWVRSQRKIGLIPWLLLDLTSICNDFKSSLLLTCGDFESNIIHLLVILYLLQHLNLFVSQDWCENNGSRLSFFFSFFKLIKLKWMPTFINQIRVSTSLSWFALISQLKLQDWCGSTFWSSGQRPRWKAFLGRSFIIIWLIQCINGNVKVIKWWNYEIMTYPIVYWIIYWHNIVVIWCYYSGDMIF